MKGFKTTRRCVRHRAFVVRALSSGEKSFIIAIRTLKTRNSGCHVNNLLPEMLMQAPAPFRALSYCYPNPHPTAPPLLSLSHSPSIKYLHGARWCCDTKYFFYESL